MKNFLINLLLTFLCLALLAVGGCFILELWMASAPKEVKVPELVGVDLLVAKDKARELGLEIVVISEEYDSELPSNTITWMTPPAGKTVKEGRTIEVRVSASEINVPDVTGMRLEGAIKVLSEKGLVGRGEKNIPSETVPEGNVVMQSPVAGSRATKKSVVRLFVSEGKPSHPLLEPTSPLTRVVRVRLPQDGKRHLVTIFVEDVYGGRIYHRRFHGAGELVEEEVTCYGSGIVKIYVDARLAHKKTIG